MGALIEKVYAMDMDMKTSNQNVLINWTLVNMGPFDTCFKLA